MNQSQNYIKGHAFFEIPGSKLSRIYQEFQKPICVICKESIDRRIQWVTDEFEDVRLFFPFKSCPVEWIRQRITATSIGAELSSPSELSSWLSMCSKGGIGIYNTPAPDVDSYRTAIRNNIVVVVHDFHDYRMLTAAATAEARNCRFMVRIGFIAGKQRWSRFGTPIERVQSLLDSFSQNAQCPKFIGFHFHLGTNLRTNAPYLEHFEKLLQCLLQLDGYNCDEDMIIDIGGGMGTPLATPYFSGKEDFTLRPKFLVRSINDLIERKGCKKKVRLWAEPGRLLAEDSTVLITRVKKVCQEPGIRFAVVEGGMQHIPTGPHTYHPIKCLGNEDSENSEWVIFGSSCMEKDIIHSSARLPKNLAAGDLLVIGGVGAYDAGMAFPFSGPLPLKVVVSTSDWTYITLNPGHSLV